MSRNESSRSKLTADNVVGEHRRGNVYLTPSEMEVMTQRWAPCRSLGVYYMWAVAEETG